MLQCGYHGSGLYFQCDQDFSMSEFRLHFTRLIYFVIYTV